MKYDRLGRSSLSRLYISKCLILGVAVSVLAVFAPVAFGQTSGNVGHIFDGDKMPIRLDPELMRRQKGYSLLVKEASNFYGLCGCA